MGLCSSKSYESRSTITQNKIYVALQKLKAENAVAEHPITFEKILLQFEQIRQVLGYVKGVYSKVSIDGNLDAEGFRMAFARLDCHMTKEEIEELLNFVDLDHNHVLNIKEFFVAITIGVALDVMPAFKSNKSAASNEESEAEEFPKKQFSTLVGHGIEINKMLHLIIQAYLLFDPEGCGRIDRKHVELMLEEHGHKADGSHDMLSKERWSEMDWDSDGSIDFAEFVFTFTKWVDIEDESDENE